MKLKFPEIARKVKSYDRPNGGRMYRNVQANKISDKYGNFTSGKSASRKSNSGTISVPLVFHGTKIVITKLGGLILLLAGATVSAVWTFIRRK
ncbi:hypothetical protein EFL83_02150 [Weissella cibaria]|uniref:hypothetical protein n=1 Tax=Weissella cibaria TaxID=137591 RepID=UPI00223C2F92|nr:hypothetical protein [Weissella cibaria]MCS9987511.1 hypothetical protein [Weissella cibaria]